MEVEALEDFVVSVGALTVPVARGEKLSSSHWIVLAYPTRFGQAEERVEQATAAPGELR